MDQRCGVGRVAGALAAALLALLASGCEGLLVPQATVTGGLGSQDMASAMAVPYYGPKARLAVVAVDNRTGKGEHIGDGLAEMLVTELVNTNRYIMLERRELGGVIAEQDLGSSGRVEPETAAPTGQIEGAELLVYGALTEFEPDYQGTGGVLTNRKYGSLALRLKQAHVALDLRVVDARTSRILAVASVTGRATDLAGSILAPVGGGRSRMALGLAAYRNQPIEKAVRVCLARAVQFIVSRTPPQYYRYAEDGQPVPATWPLPPAAPAQPAAAPPAPAPSAQDAPATLPERVRVSVATARVFAQPHAQGPVVGSVARGTLLAVQGQEDGWYAVALPDGTRGWLPKGFASPPSTTGPEGSSAPREGP